MTKTFTVRGHKIRTASTRRYIVAIVYRGDWADEAPRIHKRSDNRATAVHHADRWGIRPNSVAVVVDSVTGEEVR